MPWATQNALDQIKSLYGDLDMLADSREKSIALTKLDELRLWVCELAAQQDD